MHASSQPPALAKVLELAGLLPQAAVAAVLILGPETWHFAALSLGYAYPALILSFLGGMRWGLGAGASGAGPVPAWVWVAAVAPSLVALATAVPWAIGATWPGPSLVVLGIAILASLLVDRRLVREGLAPAWWISLRIPLSLGLGLLTILAAAIG